MTADPHQLRPDHLPTPFSADEIRVGCPGRTVRSLVTPAGRYACLRYTNRDGDSVSTFWFARSATGMPLTSEERAGGVLAFSSTAIENVPG